ncbi:MAG: deoxyribose-phosphate aldolase [Natrialbaceae archaeon]|nr:deoxyribose-phosphate aldolase [Natrialbaceae archaeon]
MDPAELRANPEQVASLIEHTNVDPTATASAIQALCTDVREYGFRSAVVVPYHAEYASECLEGTASVTAVVGFPYGVQNSRAKQLEVEALSEWVDEFDMVMNRTAFANDDFDAVVDDVAAVRETVGDQTLKCIIESPALSDDEIATAARLVAEGGADIVKTAVGYEGGCDPDEVRTIREAVGPDVGVKASGGIGTFEEALAMVEAGATRIGASAGVEILESIGD